MGFMLYAFKLKAFMGAWIFMGIFLSMLSLIISILVYNRNRISCVPSLPAAERFPLITSSPPPQQTTNSRLVVELQAVVTDESSINFKGTTGSGYTIL